MVLIIIIIALILLYLIFRNLKILKISTVNLFTGELGTGKSALSLDRAIKQYKIELFKFYIKYFLSVCLSVFYNDFLIDITTKPLFYSNIPLKDINFVFLTNDILNRDVRINNHSVVFIDEISLIVDNMNFTDKTLNENLKYFIKLFRHYSHNGYMFINTQNIQDNHYIIKRVLNRYFYIHSKIRLPFISILKVREMLYSEDSTNIVQEDIEDNTKIVFIFNSIFKKYDSLCYSVLTDFKDFHNSPIHYIKNRKYLKTNEILKYKGENKKYGR